MSSMTAQVNIPTTVNIQVRNFRSIF
jgi:hypothetical protein